MNVPVKVSRPDPAMLPYLVGSGKIKVQKKRPYRLILTDDYGVPYSPVLIMAISDQDAEEQSREFVRQGYNFFRLTRKGLK